MQGVAQRTNGSRPTSHTVERQVPVLCRPVEGNDSGSAYFWRPEAWGLEKSGHLSTGAMEGPFVRRRHQRDHSSPPSPRPSPTLTGEVYPSPTDLVETAPQRRLNSSPLVARVGVPDARVIGLSGPWGVLPLSPSPHACESTPSDIHPWAVDGIHRRKFRGVKRGRDDDSGDKYARCMYYLCRVGSWPDQEQVIGGLEGS